MKNESNSLLFCGVVPLYFINYKISKYYKIKMKRKNSLKFQLIVRFEFILIDIYTLMGVKSKFRIMEYFLNSDTVSRIEKCSFYMFKINSE